jgi:segregation and condensation protein B
MAQDAIKTVIEALLFSSDKPILIEQIRNVFTDLEPTQIRNILEELKTEYNNDNRGIRIIEVAGGFQMVTAPIFSSYLKKFYKQKHLERFSRPALETLAIVAYKQPVTRLEIESIRGVNVDGMVKHLKDVGIIRISGRKKAPGRPFVYSTTREFLEYFGLRSLEELPKIEDFSSLVSSGVTSVSSANVTGAKTISDNSDDKSKETK